jgi:hypothetical protein
MLVLTTERGERVGQCEAHFQRVLDDVESDRLAAACLLSQPRLRILSRRDPIVSIVEDVRGRFLVLGRRGFLVVVHGRSLDDSCGENGTETISSADVAWLIISTF